MPLKIPITLSELVTNRLEIETFVRHFDSSRNLATGNFKSQKREGIYYTPATIAEYLSQTTIESYIVKTVNFQSKENFNDLNEVLSSSSPVIIERCESILMKMRILDFSAGSGVILASALNILTNISQSIRNHKNKASDVKNGDHFLLKTKYHFLSRSLHGVDTDKTALRVCKLRLLLTLLENCSTGNEDLELLPVLDFTILQGNSLVGFSRYHSIGTLVDIKSPMHIYNKDKENRSQDIKIKQLNHLKEKNRCLNTRYIEHLTREKRKNLEDIEKYHPFHWIAHFPEIMDDGGFDIIIGNPPYSARITAQEKEMIQNLPSQGTTQSANLFIHRMFDLLKPNGFFGLVLPKSLCHASNWGHTRKLLIPKLERVVDVQKAFKNVLLEQILVTGSNSKVIDPLVYTRSYDPLTKFHNGEVAVKRSTLQEFNKIFLNLSEKEVSIFEKIISKCQFLGDICVIQRGFPWQRYLTLDGDQDILEGKNIRRYHVRQPYRKIPRSFVEQASENSHSTKKKFEKFSIPKVLLQNIVAHLTKPLQYIELYACVDENALLCLDTAECLYLSEESLPVINNYVLAAYINSSFASWFAYRFIYALAVRTMHFDNVQLSHLPFRFTGIRNVNDQVKNKLNLIDFDKDANGSFSNSVLSSILDLKDNDKISSLLYYIGLHSKELHEITSRLNDFWEKMIQRITSGLDKEEINRFYRIKPYLTSYEALYKQISCQKSIYRDLAEIDRILKSTFNHITTGRKKSIIIQKLIDRAVYGLFDLDQSEIEEINSSYHLRPAI